MTCSKLVAAQGTRVVLHAAVDKPGLQSRAAGTFSLAQPSFSCAGRGVINESKLLAEVSERKLRVDWCAEPLSHQCTKGCNPLRTSALPGKRRLWQLVKGTF
eukprot:1653149-Pleurochrysis_carterae.AAC.1